MTSQTAQSIDPQEVAKFSAMADEWWDENGKFKPLHRFNPTRLLYLRDSICEHYQRDPNSSKPLAGLTILDIGCGGGLLCEPLTRLGASVTGLDASEKNISIASLHAEKTGLDIDYRHDTVEHLAEQKTRYDIVLNMEVIEHVADVDGFMAASCALAKPGGIMFIATLNRTAKSFALAIVGAEYILRWLPRGTHDWRKFLTPAEIEARLRPNGLTLQHIQGVSYNPFGDKWSLSNDINVNYMMRASKAA